MTGPLVGRFCGQERPANYLSSTNTLYFNFRSDYSVSRAGFRIRYKTACGGEFSTPSGIIRSPYHPANYPHHRQCQYIISAQPGNVIQLHFSDFDVEGSWGCQFDYLEIRDGDNRNSTVLGRYCGDSSLAPDLVTSSYNYLHLTFVTDGSVQNRGFLLNYTTIEVFVAIA